ncbi:unnamed protein product [Phyllotreta striolata]|uniref:Uncharacterized protein n=1 Tax=Phyllotreta striolata TaxID=444603 RepID=A0A9N9TMV9_PHYSR|nr:unnamed protein product [Phyllotreta striolata]
MFSISVVFPIIVSVCFGAPQQSPIVQNSAQHPGAATPGQPGGDATPIAIINQTADSNPADGSFQFSFETANGIKIEEKGYLKDGANSSEKIQVIEGSVSYTDNEGNPVNLRYIADENGYQPEGDHIPKAPESPLGSQPDAAQSPSSRPAQTAQPAQSGPLAVGAAEVEQSSLATN